MNGSLVSSTKVTSTSLSSLQLTRSCRYIVTLCSDCVACSIEEEGKVVSQIAILCCLISVYYVNNNEAAKELTISETIYDVSIFSEGASSGLE